MNHERRVRKLSLLQARSMIRITHSEDAVQIADIYNHYIKHSTVTFEIDTLSSGQIAERITGTLPNYPHLVLEEDDQILGYAYLTRYRARSAYAHVAESSVYVKPDSHGRGIGRRLYQALIKQAPDYGISEIMGIIALPNDASEYLHKCIGFKKVGMLPRMGFKFDRYIDTAYWQLSV